MADEGKLVESVYVNELAKGQHVVVEINGVTYYLEVVKPRNQKYEALVSSKHIRPAQKLRVAPPYEAQGGILTTRSVTKYSKELIKVGRALHLHEVVGSTFPLEELRYVVSGVKKITIRTAVHAR